MNLYLYRRVKTITYTVGKLYFWSEFQCNVLEPPVRRLIDLNDDGDFDDADEGKVYGNTAIPAGKYQIKMQFSPHFQRQMPYLQNVPGFTAIMIHPGNSVDDTKACLLVGEYSKPGKLINSRQWSDLINKKLVKTEMNGEENFITITEE